MRSRSSSGTARDFVLADQRVAADHHRRRDRPAPHRLLAVGGVAPERVVVAVGLGDVEERVDVRAAGSAAAAGHGSGTPIRSRSRATPSSVIFPAGRSAIAAQRPSGENGNPNSSIAVPRAIRVTSSWLRNPNCVAAASLECGHVLSECG